MKDENPPDVPPTLKRGSSDLKPKGFTQAKPTKGSKKGAKKGNGHTPPRKPPKGKK